MVWKPGGWNQLRASVNILAKSHSKTEALGSLTKYLSPELRRILAIWIHRGGFINDMRQMSITFNTACSTSAQMSSAPWLIWFSSARFISENSCLCGTEPASSEPEAEWRQTGLCCHLTELFDDRDFYNNAVILWRNKCIFPPKMSLLLFLNVLEWGDTKTPPTCQPEKGLFAVFRNMYHLLLDNHRNNVILDLS